MIRLKQNTRVMLMMTHGFLMVALGFGLLYIRAAMTNALYYVFGCIFSLLLIAASLLFIAILDWVCAASLGPAQVGRLRGLLALSSVAAAVSIVLIIDPGSTIRSLCYLTALYALFLSIGKLDLARHWSGPRLEQAIMYFLMALDFLFSAVLAAVAYFGEDERNILGMIAGYSIFIGLQMFLSVYFQQQQMQKTVQAGAKVA